MYRLAKVRNVGQFGPGGVPAAVLAEGDVAVDQRGFDGRELGGAQVLLAQQPVDRTGAHRRQEHALGVHPSVALRGARR